MEYFYQCPVTVIELENKLNHCLVRFLSSNTNYIAGGKDGINMKNVTCCLRNIFNNKKEIV